MFYNITQQHSGKFVTSIVPFKTAPYQTDYDVLEYTEIEKAMQVCIYLNSTRNEEQKFIIIQNNKK